MPTTRWLTFDCYGTLVDWRHGIRCGAELVAPGHGEELLRAYHRNEAAVQAHAPGTRYRDVLARTLEVSLDELGLDVVPDQLSVLGAMIGYWPVFPEVPAALAAARAAGWNLALLTNCDRDIVAQSLRRIGVPVDAVVTAEDVGGYKPSHAHFDRFAASFRPDPGRWVHVAQSWFHDMVPAAELGLDRVWVNRLAETHDETAVPAVVPDLTDLVATVDRVAGRARP